MYDIYIKVLLLEKTPFIVCYNFPLFLHLLYSYLFENLRVCAFKSPLSTSSLSSISHISCYFYHALPIPIIFAYSFVYILYLSFPLPLCLRPSLIKPSSLSLSHFSSHFGLYKTFPFPPFPPLRSFPLLPFAMVTPHMRCLALGDGKTSQPMDA